MSPLRVKRSKVHSNYTVNTPLAAVTAGAACPIKCNDQNPPDQSRLRILLLTRRLVEVWSSFKGTSNGLQCLSSAFHQPVRFTLLSGEPWHYRNGREKRAYFCALSAYYCQFMRFTSSCPERGIQITGRCATWGSL